MKQWGWELSCCKTGGPWAPLDYFLIPTARSEIGANIQSRTALPPDFTFNNVATSLMNDCLKKWLLNWVVSSENSSSHCRTPANSQQTLTPIPRRDILFHRKNRYAPVEDDYGSNCSSPSAPTMWCCIFRLLNISVVKADAQRPTSISSRWWSLLVQQMLLSNYAVPQFPTWPFENGDKSPTAHRKSPYLPRENINPESIRFAFVGNGDGFRSHFLICTSSYKIFFFERSDYEGGVTVALLLLINWILMLFHVDD